MPTLHAIPYQIPSRMLYPLVCRKFQTTCPCKILAGKTKPYRRRHAHTHKSSHDGE
ncbi:hypothetical protein MCC93_13470 [Morococcus cerebrosus]|uniref:Uncharacterized protein n=1 Tax=Morococcus cerebrosus TaxID=1056807 RepID=A0A0C1E6C1_9NEIS|nr:hypothetical protein MCC93_13470 [Morococcus cerebrosus]